MTNHQGSKHQGQQGKDAKSSNNSKDQRQQGGGQRRDGLRPQGERGDAGQRSGEQSREEPGRGKRDR